MMEGFKRVKKELSDGQIRDNILAKLDEFKRQKELELAKRNLFNLLNGFEQVAA